MNLVDVSGREDLALPDRMGLLRAELMQSPFNHLPERSINQSIHDLKVLVGEVRALLDLYDAARARGTTDEELERGASRLVSPVECRVLAWRRGGHLEYVRVVKLQRKAIS